MIKRKKKILHLTFDMRIGGTEQVIKNLIEGTDTNEFDVSIYCIESPLGPFGKILIEQGIKIHSISRKQGFDKKLILHIRKYIKENNIDILHCHQYTPWVYGTLAAIFTKTKIIFTEHGRFYPDSSSWKRKLINPVLNLFTANVVAISKATKQALIEYENIPERSIEVIYNGIADLTVDTDRTHELKKSLSIDDNQFVFGTIARFDPIKNHKMMVKAFAQLLLSHPNTVLIMVGDGEERGNIEKLVGELNISNKVVFTGYNPHPQHLLALMDVYLLSSFSEGTSMTLLEAMSLGKPCIVTDAGGNAEIIQHNVNGLVTENDNLKQFAASCSELLDDKVSWEKFSLQSLRMYEEKFTLEVMLEQYKRLYYSRNQ